jgi:hypothetical protein
MATNSDYSTLELRQMDEETARQTLPIAEYERWEKLHDLIDGAEETRSDWDDADKRATDLAVHADMADLATAVDLFGNDVLVHVDPEAADFREAYDVLEAAIEGVDEETVEELDDDAIDTIGSALQQMLDEVLVEWNGHEWDALDDSLRADVLADARDKWGLSGFLDAWYKIAESVAKDREEKVSSIESFRSAERRGRR